MTKRLQDPIFLALAMFVLTLICSGGAIMLDKMGAFEADKLNSWLFSTSFLLLFAIGSSLMSIQSTNTASYWSRSMWGFLGLGLTNGLLAWAISGVPIGEAESYKGIYLVVAIGFLVFLSMLNFLKKIVTFAEKEEWNHPRMRSKK